MSRRTPTPVFDHEYLIGFDDNDDNPYEIFYLSPAAQKVLAELAQIVLWPTRWPDQDEDDWLPLAHRIYEELKVPVHIDDLIPYVDEIETLLRNLQAIGGCCGDNTTGLPSPVELTEDWPTTPPSTWAGETVADADDWVDLVCGAAHAWLDALIDTTEYLDVLWNEGVVNIKAIAEGLGLLAVAGVLLEVPYAVALAVTAGLAALAYSAIFVPAGEDLEGARSDIMCAMVNGTAEDVSDAIEAAVSATAWSLWLRWFDYASIQATLVAGELPDGTHLTTIDRTKDCSCTAPVSSITWTFDTDNEGWERSDDPTVWNSDGCGPSGGCLGFPQSSSGLFYTSPTFLMESGNRVGIGFYIKSRSGSGAYVNFALKRASDDAILATLASNQGTHDTECVHRGPPPVEGIYPQQLVYLVMDDNSGDPSVDTIIFTVSTV